MEHGECCLCRFWAAHRDHVLGQCRLRPPIYHDEHGGVFPVTNDTDWCGEFQRQPFAREALAQAKAG